MIGTRRDFTAMIGGFAALTFALPVLALPEPPVRQIRRAYIDGGMGQIHLRIAEPEGILATSPPLVLFHQTPLSGRMFERLIPHLAKTRMVIAIDTPGYGESDRPAERPSLDAYGDTMLDALVETFGRQFDVFGYHTGAVIAADLAARRPEIERCILVSVPLFEQDRRLSLLAQLEKGSVTYSADGSHLLPLWSGTYGVRPLGQSLDDVARLVAEKQRAGRFNEWALRSAVEVDLASLLVSISKPSLVLAPHDGLETQSSRAAIILGAKLVDLPDLAYGLFDTSAPRIAMEVGSFLSQT